MSNELLAERGLPDTGLANHCDERALASGRALIGGLKLPQLAVSPDEWRLL
jgi:hypothetical protein